MQALRLAPLALACAAAHDVSLSLGTLEALIRARRMAAVTVMRIEARAPALTDYLGKRGILGLVLKGSGIAKAYTNPEWRPFVDLDLLVRPGQFSGAVRALEALGFEEPPELMRPRGYYARHCLEAITLRDREGMTVDLHHHVPPWIWGATLTADVLATRSEDLSIGGGAVRVPHPVHNLLIAALHSISDRGRRGFALLMWRDIVALAGVCDFQDAQDTAHRLDLGWLVPYVTEQLPDFARPVASREGVWASLPLETALRLRRIIPPSMWSTHQVARMFRLPAWNALAYLGGYVFPSRAFLANRYGAPHAYLRWWRDASARLGARATLTQ